MNIMIVFMPAMSVSPRGTRSKKARVISAGILCRFFFAKFNDRGFKPNKMENGSRSYHILSVPKFKKDQNLNLGTGNKRTSQLRILQNEQLKINTAK
jgi:hypothetical protein